MKTQLTDAELWQCMLEAEQRKSDDTLPLDVRVRSFETFAICLTEAMNRGYDYGALKEKFATKPLTQSQKMRKAGYARRPSVKSLSSDE